MGYGIYITDKDGCVLEVTIRHEIKGSIYALGGTMLLEMSMTYNYVGHITKAGLSIRELNGRSIEETKPLIQSAIDKLGDDVTSNYWDATEGNAKKALSDMLELASLCWDKTAVWSIR